MAKTKVPTIPEWIASVNKSLDTLSVSITELQRFADPKLRSSRPKGLTLSTYASVVIGNAKIATNALNQMQVILDNSGAAKSKIDFVTKDANYFLRTTFFGQFFADRFSNETTANAYSDGLKKDILMIKQWLSTTVRPLG